jgi:hypothetical protein
MRDSEGGRERGTSDLLDSDSEAPAAAALATDYWQATRAGPAGGGPVQLRVRVRHARAWGLPVQQHTIGL